MKYKWFEGIFTMCGLAFALEGDPPIPATEATEQAILDDIKDINNDYAEQIKAGERDEGDEYEGFPIYGLLKGDFVIECDPETDEEICHHNWTNQL